MITEEEIRQRWTTLPDHAPEMWDSQANRTNYLTIPSFEDNRLLQEMEARGYLHPDAKVLDVGCGAGAYSVAVAPRVKSVVGTDFSPKMIANGKELVAEHDAHNVELVEANWHTLDLDSHGWAGAFDLAFVRNSPAMGSAEMLDKLLATSTKNFAMTAPTNRQEPLITQIREHLGLDTKTGPQGNLLYVLNLLLLMGYQPEIAYEDTEWLLEQPVEEATTFFSGRLNLHEDEQISQLREYLDSVAVDGMVSSRSTVTIQMLFWQALD